MQRVLSFNVSRSFGASESSEFITKRTCFSFLFAFGFLGLLGGFLLGRLATDRTIKIEEQKILRELEGNGLHVTKDMQITMLDILNTSTFYENYKNDSNVESLHLQGVDRVKDIFADLSIFRLNVEETNTSTVATICGIQEQDRYIVLSASGEGFDVAIKLARTLDAMYRDKDWEPKRTLIFCVFLGSKDYCSEKFLDRVKPKIVAYIAVHGNAARGSDFVVAGSGMVQATVLDAINEVKYYHENTFNAVHRLNSLPRLNIDVPHAVLSFLDNSAVNNSQSVTHNQKILAQILGLTMFRLSEEIFFQWDPKYFSDIINSFLTTIVRPELTKSKDNLNQTANALIESVTNFNKELENVNLLKALEVRMINDRLIDLERALLCADSSSQSRTDFKRFNMLPHESILNELSDCYKAANNILVDQAFCKTIFKNST